MKKTLLFGLLLSFITLFTIAGCGPSDGDDDTPAPPAQPTTAVVKLLSQGTGTLHGIDATVVLPAGVTVKATPDAVNTSVMVTDAGVVAASGAAAGASTSAIATYTAATATPSGAAGTVVVHVANPGGFATGEFVTITCDIATGSFPVSADFSVTGFGAVDGNGVAIAGVTAGYTVDIQ